MGHLLMPRHLRGLGLSSAHRFAGPFCHQVKWDLFMKINWKLTILTTLTHSIESKRENKNNQSLRVNIKSLNAGM